MTIAVCYLSPEGFVLGADSTSTYNTPGVPHYFNHAQKIFEIGTDSSLGIVTWGLGSLGTISYRLLVAELADSLAANKPVSVHDVVERWIDLFWDKYENGPVGPEIVRVRGLGAMAQYDPADVGAPGKRTEAEQREFDDVRDNLVVGFCIGGYVDASRVPSAEVVIFDPLGHRPIGQVMPIQASAGWGAPIMIQRLIRGFDDRVRAEILGSGKWQGSSSDLDAILMQYQLSHPILPIRDAVDFVHTCVYSTIKAFKFSSLSQICGGPIEIAVITADRKFRWVRHKQWDSAITDGEP